MRTLLWAISLALLAGCATPAADRRVRIDAPVRPGMVLVLDERLGLAADARVYFQNGAVTRFHDRDRFAPWCSVGVRRGDDGELPAAVEAGRFTITGVRSGARADAGPPVQVAGRSLAGMGLDRGDHPGHLTWTLEMRLDSVAQPAVHDLRCAIDRPSDWRGRVGVESVRAALGGIGRLLAPDE